MTILWFANGQEITKEEAIRLFKKNMKKSIRKEKQTNE